MSDISEGALLGSEMSLERRLPYLSLGEDKEAIAEHGGPLYPFPFKLPWVPPGEDKI